MSSAQLADVLAGREAGHQFVQYILRGLMAPLEDAVGQADRSVRTELECTVSRYENGRRLVNVQEVVRVRDRFEALEMAPLTRAAFEEALLAVTDPIAEDHLRDRVARDVNVLRARHRRVRNAVTHGNPVTSAALASVREYGDDVAHDALWMALGAFARQTAVTDAFNADAERRDQDRIARTGGASYVERTSTSLE